MQIRYSKQREIIYDLLKGTKSHPTAEWIYKRAREKDASISLGTVYRNLKFLCDTGRAVAINTSDSKVHYDACIDCHGHFVCDACGKIYDFNLNFTPPTELKDKGFEVKKECSVFYGTCANCLKN